jgi:methylated-DNA-[protein]-cysteine S-methyltransferase
MATVHSIVDSPIGELTVVADDGTLTGLYFPRQWYRPDPRTFGPRVDGGFEEVSRQLGEYLAGRRRRFDLPVDARGDDFQRRVWGLLDEIPYGQTTTYGELAGRLGDPTLARAVGAAVGRNPLCVVVPCHRVLGKDGALTGYAGGLKRKKFLLDLEEPAAVTAGRLF